MANSKRNLLHWGVLRMWTSKRVLGGNQTCCDLHCGGAPDGNTLIQYFKTNSLLRGREGDGCSDYEPQPPHMHQSFLCPRRMSNSSPLLLACSPTAANELNSWENFPTKLSFSPPTIRYKKDNYSFSPSDSPKNLQLTQSIEPIAYF